MHRHRRPGSPLPQHSFSVRVPALNSYDNEKDQEPNYLQQIIYRPLPPTSYFNRTTMSHHSSSKMFVQTNIAACNSIRAQILRKLSPLPNPFNYTLTNAPGIAPTPYGASPRALKHGYAVKVHREGNGIGEYRYHV